MNQEEQLVTDLKLEWETQPPITFSLDRCSLCTIVGTLQFALRHPAIAAMAGAAPIVRQFIAESYRASGPAMRKAIALGFDPDYDLEISEESWEGQ